MQFATDKIQVFTPETIARKIGGDTSDVMGVLNVCFLKGADAAVQWMVQGDYSKPWAFSDSDKRGDALLDMRTTKLCADLHEVAVRPADHGPVSKANELKIIKTVLMDNFPFSGRQFHRVEIARWLVAFGLRSEYEFSQEAEPKAAPVVTAGASDGEAWKNKAIKRAAEIIETRRAKDLYPNQLNIADEIAKEFRTAGIVGADGKPLTGSTIKRHALRGISSAKDKRLSTAIRRGK